MLLNKFDFISPQITLYYHKQERHVNPFSGCLTLTVYISILICSLIFLIQFISKSEPIIFFYKYYENDVGYYYFNTSNFFHYVTFGSNLIDYSSVNIIGVPKFIQSYTQNNTLSLLDTYYIYGQCSERDIKGLNVDNINKTEFTTNAACIRSMYNKQQNKFITTEDDDFYYPDLRHGASNPNYNLYAVIIELCRNDSQFNDNRCNSPEQIEQYISTLNAVSLYVVDHIVNVEDYNKPIISFLNKISSGTISNSFNSNQLNFNPLIVKTDHGVLFSSFEDIKSHIFDQNVKSRMDAGNTGIIAAYNFWIQNNVQIYSRSYKKLQDTCANIGGVSKMILIICDVVNYVFRELTFVLDTMKLYSVYACKKYARVNDSASCSHNLSQSHNCSHEGLKLCQKESYCVNGVNGVNANDDVRNKQTVVTMKICGCETKKQNENDCCDNNNNNVKACSSSIVNKTHNNNAKAKAIINGVKLNFNCENICDYLRLIMFNSYKRSSHGKTFLFFTYQRRNILSEEHLFDNYFLNKCIIKKIEETNNNEYPHINGINTNINTNNNIKQLTMFTKNKTKWLSDIPIYVHNRKSSCNK